MSEAKKMVKHVCFNLSYLILGCLTSHLFCLLHPHLSSSFSILKSQWCFSVPGNCSKTLCSNHWRAFLEDQSPILRTRLPAHKKGSGHLLLFHFLLLHSSAAWEVENLVDSEIMDWFCWEIVTPKQIENQNLHQFTTSHWMSRFVCSIFLWLLKPETNVFTPKLIIRGSCRSYLNEYCDDK